MSLPPPHLPPGTIFLVLYPLVCSRFYGSVKVLKQIRFDETFKLSLFLILCFGGLYRAETVVRLAQSSTTSVVVALYVLFWIDAFDNKLYIAHKLQFLNHLSPVFYLYLFSLCLFPITLIPYELVF